MKKIVKTIPLALLLPGVVLAQANLQWFIDFANDLGTIIGILIPVFIALALLMFIWGMVQFIMSAGDDQGRAEGKQKMIWGVLALFVIVSIWGLTELLNSIFGINPSDTAPNVPSVPQA